MPKRSLSMLLAAPLALAACGPDGGNGGDLPCADLAPGELVITEIFGDYVGVDSGEDDGHEWFEIHNSGGGAVDVEGLTIVHSRPDGGSEKSHTVGTLTIPAGGYVALGDVLPEFVGGHLAYGYANELGSFFNSGGGKLTLRCGDEELDTALYEEPEAGSSIAFDGSAPPDYTTNDDLSLWCATPEEAGYEFETGNYGTPGEFNHDCAGGSTGMCDDGGTLRPAVTPAPGDLIITEAMPSPSTPQADKEWFEVHVTRDVDLYRIALGRANGERETLEGDACRSVSAGDYLVFARNDTAAANGMLPRVDGTFGFSLVEDVRVEDSGGNVIDAVTFAGAGTARSFQLDPDFVDPAANDEERYWCDATAAWAGADLGSPGVANEQCEILPPAGFCVDPDDGAERAIVTPTAGQLVITEVMHSPSADQADREWFEARATVALDLNGLQLDREDDTTATPNLISSADCLEVDAGGYALFARNVTAADNGGLPAVDGRFTFTLVPNARIAIKDPDGALIDAVDELDATDMMYCESTGEACQLDPDVTDSAGNDTESNWCDAATMYGSVTDKGTPKLVNDVQCN